MRTIYDKRLLKLAKHLESGKLGHKKFDFGVVNATKQYGPAGYECGYAGCAGGELPILFSSYFTWADFPYKYFTDETEYKIRKFFDLNVEDFKCLFMPTVLMEGYYRERLPADATKEEVALRIRDFVALREAGMRT